MTIHEINIRQEFDAPIGQVWEAFNDHENFGKMFGQKIQRIVDSPDKTNINGIGSVRLIKAPMMPFEETVMRSEKPSCIEYKISRGTPIDHHYGSMRFSSLDNGKRSAMEYTIKLGSKIPLLGLLVKTVLQKEMTKGIKKYADSLS
jgi:hypothetical protein